MIIDSTFTNEGPGFVIRPPRTTSSTIELNIVYTREECFYFFAEPRVCGVSTFTKRRGYAVDISSFSLANPSRLKYR
jgi:hypothetical protein